MNYKTITKNKKGVAGLEIILSVVSMLFLIGIIVMIFSLAGSKLNTAVAETSSGTFYENMTVGTSAVALSVDSTYNCEVQTITARNVSTLSYITYGNYTYAGCQITAIETATGNYSTSWTLNGTYNYRSNTRVAEIINDTTGSISDVIDWFPTFIVLAAMIVLILLVVIIIRSIKGSGITEGA